MNGAMLLTRVERMCEKNGISICKLEREAGIGNGIISRWSGVEMPALKNVKKVAEYFGVEIGDLLKEDE